MPKLFPYHRFGPKYQDKRNWKVYNKQLVRRGELYISLDFIDNWDQELQQMNNGKVGRKYIYPEKFIKWTALVYHVMNMPYRTIQGFLRSLSRYIPKLKAADYTTLFRRMKHVDIKLQDSMKLPNGPFIVAVDTTGIKITTRGDWIRHKWKRKGHNHKGWVKIHMAVDTRRKEILALDITDEHIGDDSAFSGLMDQCYDNIGESKIKKVLADGAYDRVKIYHYLYLNRIKSGIKMRKDAVPEFKGSHYRVECVSNRNKIGHSAWKEQVGYSKRWASEAVFSSVKRMLGEAVRSKSKQGSLREAYRKFVFYNILNNYGRGKISGI